MKKANDMEQRSSKAAEARRGVAQRLEGRVAKADQRSKDVMDFQRRRREAEEAKMLRLKSLRLAKEETDRQAAEVASQAAALSAPPRRHKKKAPPPTSD